MYEDFPEVPIKFKKKRKADTISFLYQIIFGGMAGLFVGSLILKYLFHT